jgi:acetate kinase
LDTLVFAGGIGQDAPLIQERICDGLGLFGIERHQKRHAKNAPLILPDVSRVKAWVVRALNLGSIRET